MPTYEYACKHCGIIEVFQSIKEAPLTKCPTCRAAGLQRMISGGAGVIFKGSGFWETDYNRGADYKKKAKADTKTDPATPAAKTEPKLQPAPTSTPTPSSTDVKPSTKGD
jgi:putative FmdB family regulatory protein